LSEVADYLQPEAKMDKPNHPYAPFVSSFLSGDPDRRESSLAAVAESEDEAAMPSFAERLGSIRSAVSSVMEDGENQAVIMTQFRKITDFSNIGWN
jgi:hypothetical protein